MFSLAQAREAFDDEGGIASEQLADRFRGTISAFMELAEATKHYPCAKKAWVEFLSEGPTAWTDRPQ
jgi:hypothetical protein